TECCRLFESLGISKLLQMQQAAVRFPPHMEVISTYNKPSIYTILRAHEDLMETSHENKSKFRLLREILEKKINQEE
ncbi:MAG: hypothetical protein P8107_15510, partial [Spirochaetia bacterium]